MLGDSVNQVAAAEALLNAGGGDIREDHVGHLIDGTG